MTKQFTYNFRNIAIAFAVAMFFLSCNDTYERVGSEAKELIYPQGIAQNFVLTYTEGEKNLSNEDTANSTILAVLESPISEDFENLRFPYKTFPEGLLVNFYDKDNNKSVIVADYGILYSISNIVDLQGNVVITMHDGKILETPQLYWDRANQWIFTQEKFKFTNPEDGTIMDGEGMDFNREFSFLNAHRTFGIMTIKEE